MRQQGLARQDAGMVPLRNQIVICATVQDVVEK